MRKGCLIAFVATIAVGFGVYHLLMRSLFPSPIPAPGWTCKADKISCTANNGEWQGIRVGMTHDEALQAFCALLKRGTLPNPRSEATALPARLEGDRCKPSPTELARRPAKINPNTNPPTWFFDPPDMWCSLHTSRQHVVVDFDEQLRVARIESYCSQGYF